MEKIDTLIFSGGGIRCISILGCLSYLIKNGILEDKFKNIKKIHFTSGSSIFTLPLLIGFNIQTTIEIFKKIEWKKIFLDEHINIKDLFTKYGMLDCNNFNYILEVFLDNKNLNKEITLKEVYELNNIEINFNSVNITRNKYEPINYKNYPDLPIIKAINMTSAIPLLTFPVEYKQELFVDGGLIENIKCKELNNKNTIGINILSNVVFNLYENNDISKNDFKNLKDYMGYLFSIYGTSSTEESIYNITLKIDGYNPLDMNKDISNIIKSGYENTKEHFKNYKYNCLENQLNEDQKNKEKN